MINSVNLLVFLAALWLEHKEGGAAANPLAAILGAVAQGANQPAQNQQQQAKPGEANPLAALGAIGALAGALGGAAQPQQQNQQQTQSQSPTAADLLGGLAQVLAQGKK